MEYLPSMHKNLLSSKKIKNSQDSKLDKNQKKETEEYALGDQRSLIKSKKSSKQTESSIYVHKTHPIRNKISNSSTDHHKKIINRIQDHSLNKIIHECGNHNHQCMTQTSFLRNILPLRSRKNKSVIKNKLKKSVLSDVNKSDKKELLEIEETYWKPNKSETNDNFFHNKSKTVEHDNDKTSISTLKDYSIQNIFLFNNSKKKDKRASNKSERNLKIYPTSSIKTNLTFYSQEIETNKVDYDESLLMQRKIMPNTTILRTEDEKISVNNCQVSTTTQHSKDGKKSSNSISIKRKIKEINKNDNLIFSEDKSEKFNKSEDFNKNSFKEPEQDYEEILAQVDDSDHEKISNRLKHTDSLILAKEVKKKSKNKVHIKQPTAIRLFKHLSRIKLGKSKKFRAIEENNKNVPTIKLGKPASPILVNNNSLKK